MENNFSLLNLFMSDLMTFIVSVVLVVFSVLSWTIIVEKNSFVAYGKKKSNYRYRY